MTIVIMSLEPLESRYTKQWHVGIKEQLEKRGGTVIQIDGDTNSGKPTEGAFLDFFSTNLWKNEQVNKLLRLTQEGVIGKGDHILFTDAWNPTILETKYVNDLMQMNWTLHGIWHAGSYDPADFLGRLITDKRWVRSTEQAIFWALDKSYYATEFHIDLFTQSLLSMGDQMRANVEARIIRSGQPHEKLLEVLTPFVDKFEKENLILFPHRIAPEKQPEIFRDLAASLPQYEFVICQEKSLSKDEYHTLLAKSKIVFSASQQETLGIGAIEAVKLKSIPMLPDRLSYSEMYESEFLYPSVWTEDYNLYQQYKTAIINRLINYVENYESYAAVLESQLIRLDDNYLHGDVMYENLLGKC